MDELPRYILVTGTDTGVGKTYVTAALAAGLLVRAVKQRVVHTRPVRALKPVATGVPEGEVPEDAALIALGAGHEPLWYAAFTEALSPHLAAERDVRPLNVLGMEAWIREEAGAITLVEGAGGWEVPLSLDFRVADLASALLAEVIVVARNRLGVLNHVLLTVNAVRARGRKVLGVVLSPPEANDLVARTNPIELRRLLPGIPVVEMGHLSIDDEESRWWVGGDLVEALGF